MTAGPVLAHGLGGRTDLPLPAWMFAYGAALALLISFAGLALLWPRSRLEPGSAGPTLAQSGNRLVRALVVLGRVVGLGGFVLVLLAAGVGTDDPSENLAPVAVYVVFWVGVLFVSGLVGDVWRVLSPFDTLALAWERVQGGRASGDGGDEAGATRFGYWPGAAGLAGFVWVELVFPDRAQPRVLFFLIALYTLAVLCGAATWGRRWLRTGEAFAALFGIVAHMAPMYRDGEGRLRARPPFAGLATLHPAPGLEAVVIIALGSTTFDGLTRTQFWTDLVSDMSEATAVLTGTVVLAWAIALVAVTYAGAMRIASRLVGSRREPGGLRAAFAHSLVPIAFAYAVAHYFSLLVLEGQAAISLASDPLGRGWDLIGTAGRAVDFGLVTPVTVAWVQAAAIMVGHMAGVVVAHDRALVLFDKRQATRSQYPLLATMVVFTVGGLLLLLGG